ncbi:MAG TPA: hypothetical protein PLC42_06565 [Parachlamydiaceae bacterium]|nr:hypothetical protein [Parachlamydiaceae bacterium]
MALYKNQRLVLLSYQPKNIFEYAELLWIKIKNFVLNIFNPILENNEKIEAIKKEINAYHFSKLNKTTMEPYQPSKELSELLAKTVVNCEKMDRFLKETRQTDKL